MNNLPLSQEMMIKVLRNGTYYFPATKHYNNNATSVICDRCHKSGLDVCIGLDSYDLCLPCIQEISRIYNPSTVNPPPVFHGSYEPHGPIMTMMVQEQFNPGDDVKTFMVQEQFNPRRVDVKSYMMQEQFNPISFGVCTNMMQGSCRKY